MHVTDGSHARHPTREEPPRERHGVHVESRGRRSADHDHEPRQDERQSQGQAGQPEDACVASSQNWVLRDAHPGPPRRQQRLQGTVLRARSPTPALLQRPEPRPTPASGDPSRTHQRPGFTIKMRGRFRRPLATCPSAGASPQSSFTAPTTSLLSSAISSHDVGNPSSLLPASTEDADNAGHLQWIRHHARLREERQPRPTEASDPAAVSDCHRSEVRASSGG